MRQAYLCQTNSKDVSKQVGSTLSEVWFRDPRSLIIILLPVNIIAGEVGLKDSCLQANP